MRETAALARQRDAGWRMLLDGRVDPEVERVLDLLLLSDLAASDVQALSGGERQRVAIATALLQGTPLLLLDEPASHLDLAHQRLLVAILLAHAGQGGAVVASLHDLNLAWDLASHVILLDGAGHAVAGTRAEVLGADRLGAEFGVPIHAVAQWRNALRDRRYAAALERSRAMSEARRLRAAVSREGRRAIAALALMASIDAGALTAVDDGGRRVSFDRPPQRVVTLAPSLAELVFAAGAGAALVGVSALSDYPPQARRIARIGDASRLDVERVLALRPEVVLVWQRGATSRELAQLEARNPFCSSSSRAGSTMSARAIERLGAARPRRRSGTARARCAIEALDRFARRHAAAPPGDGLLPGVAATADDRQRPADHQ